MMNSIVVAQSAMVLLRLYTYSERSTYDGTAVLRTLPHTSHSYAVCDAYLFDYCLLCCGYSPHSSKMWLKEVATALKEEDSIETVFVLKHCPYMMKKPFASNLLDLSTSSSSNYGKWLKVGVALY